MNKALIIHSILTHICIYKHTRVYGTYACKKTFMKSLFKKYYITNMCITDKHKILVLFSRIIYQLPFIKYFIVSYIII